MSELIEKISEYQRSRGGAHRAGSLMPAPLYRIEWYFENYFKGRPVRSAETGCGASTIVFSAYSDHHTAYCYDDRADENSSVTFATDYPEFPHERVDWVFGPTQRTIFSNPLKEDIDILLIDGPHGYPFPELEYFAFYKRLKPHGILIVDDIHIPTINNLYKFLVQDDCFRLHGLAFTTAYFQRTDRPAFNMEGDDWWLQRYNVQRFPAIGFDEINAGVKLPVAFEFTGKLNDNGPLLTRGFSMQNGEPVTEGEVTAIDVKIAPAAPKRVRLTLDVEPVCIEERLQAAPEAGFKLALNNGPIAEFSFLDSRRRTLQVEAETDGSENLHLEFWHKGLRFGNDLIAWQRSPGFDARLPNFFLRSMTIADAEAPVSKPNTITRTDGSVVSFDHEGRRVSFLIDETRDSVQTFHANGRFYELDELNLIRAAVAPGAEILEVGAHVGNHTIFFSTFMGAKRVVPIEPSRRAQAALRINCALNDTRNVDLSHVDHALGGEAGSGRIVQASLFNAGGASIVADPGGSVRMVTGDQLFAYQSFDFIKIDVEGMELETLAGLSGLIARCRPILFVEVKESNVPGFYKLLEEWRYEVSAQTQMYPHLTNYLAMPTSAQNPELVPAPQALN